MLVVRALVDTVEKAGGSSAELLRAAGVNAAQLEARDARLPLCEHYRMLGLALDLTGDPALGLHAAEQWTATTFVPISYLMAHSQSLRRAFESISRFGSLLSDELGYELLEHDDKATLYCRPPGGASVHIQRLVAEMVVASFFRILRSFNVPAQPERVCFDYCAPDYADEYARIFGAAAHFEQSFTGIVFDRSLLELTQPHKDEGLHEALQTLAERRVSCVTQNVPYALRVREVLIQRGWPERIDMQTVARELGVSARSLRRRLASEGKSYAEIEHDAFEIVATRLLRDQKRTIHEAAYEMGFADANTFHRAFKRSTGTTPNRYLRRLR